MDLLASNLDDEYSSLLHASTEYSLLKMRQANGSFEMLTTYLARLEEVRAEAMAATLTIPNGDSDGSAGKRDAEEGLEEGKKKKVKVSQGVKALEKVNTRGMKDMRSFFIKKPVKT